MNTLRSFRAWLRREREMCVALAVWAAGLWFLAWLRNDCYWLVVAAAALYLYGAQEIINDRREGIF